MKTAINYLNNKNKSYKIGFLLLTLITLMDSCVKDDTTQPSSTQGTADIRSSFEGSWLCSENTNSTNSKFTISIARDASNTTNIVISNFSNLGSKYTANAIVTGNDLKISRQPINGDYYEGTGQLSSGRITLYYKKTDVNNVITNIQAVCTK